MGAILKASFWKCRFNPPITFCATLPRTTKDSTSKFIALFMPPPEPPSPPIKTSKVRKTSPCKTIMALAEVLWNCAICSCIRGPLATPNSLAKVTKASRLSIAPDWINLGPAVRPKISAARAAFSSALSIFCNDVNTSFRTSSALLSF